MPAPSLPDPPAGGSSSLLADASLLPLLFDAHAHHPEKWGPSVPHRFIASGFSPDTNAALLSMMASCPRGWFTLGFAPQELQRADRHPNPLLAISSFESQLHTALDDPLLRLRLVGIGEVGLDSHWGKSEDERARQFEGFERLIALALKHDLPLVIHSRDAEENCLKLLFAARVKMAMMHCFGGKLGQAQSAADAGYLVSIPPQPNSERKKIIKALPISSLVVESDAPYIAKESAQALESAKMIARYKGIEVREVLVETAKNAERFFGLAP